MQKRHGESRPRLAQNTVTARRPARLIRLQATGDRLHLMGADRRRPAGSFNLRASNKTAIEKK